MDSPVLDFLPVEPNRFVVRLDYFSEGKDLLITASLPDKNVAKRFIIALNREFKDNPYSLSYEIQTYLDTDFDELISVVNEKYPTDREYWSILKDCESALSKQQINNHIDEADYFCVPGNIGGKAYIILQDGVNRHIAEGIITDITARKRNDSFAVKFIVNYEEGSSIIRKEFLYGIDAFITPEEAKVGLALMEI